MNTKHTPGPWKLTDDPPLHHACVWGAGEPVASVYCGTAEAANARLIALAPELFEMLDAVVWSLDHNAPPEHLQGHLNRARAVLAKLDGKEVADD